MPNWAEGYLRLRGKPRMLVEFIKRELELVYRKRGMIEAKSIPLREFISTSEFDYDLDICIADCVRKVCEDAAWPSLYIKGTHRNFIDKDIYVFLDDDWQESENDIVLAMAGFKAAWDVKAEPYVKKSQEYGIDIKIDVWERGAEFSREIEIIHGEVKINEVHEYDCWEWDSANPHFGG